MMKQNSFFNKYSKKYLIQPDAGLGNRLYCMYSALYYSIQTKRPFDIIWLRETCCNVRYDELFDMSGFIYGENVIYKPKIITTYHLGYKNRYSLVSVLSDIYMIYIKHKYHYYTSEDTRALFFSEGPEKIKKVISDDADICIKANGNFIDMDEYKDIVHMIKPSKKIEKIVEEIMSPYGGKKVCGVHIRRTDNKVSIDNSPLEMFREKMRLEVIDNPDTAFYLASDDEEVIKDFSLEFNLIPHKHLSDKISRSSSNGMIDAYVDMLCLSRCDLIYGSYGSSFSDLASLIGSVSLEVIRGV